MKNRSYYLECALILVFLYFGLKAIDYHNAISGATEAEKYSAAFGLTLLLPHYLLIFLGAISTSLLYSASTVGRFLPPQSYIRLEAFWVLVDFYSRSFPWFYVTSNMAFPNIMINI